ncbi:MAG: C25 family cysteine peptidase [Acidobacteriota bacterium]
MNEQLLYFNGINAATGEYLRPPMPLSEFSRMAGRDRVEPVQRARGILAGEDPSDLAAAGWGVIFPQDADPAVREALKPLLERRRSQAGLRAEWHYRELTYICGEGKDEFLRRHEVGPGWVDPDVMPYYLLVVGTPEQIPFDFQYQLDVQYAVGRICFDTPQEYARYALSVVDTEQNRLAKSRRITFFGVQNRDDPPTRLSVEHLVDRLWEKLGRRTSGWDLVTLVTEETSKAQLGRLLGGADTPALLFTAGHAVCFPAGDPQQLTKQGALVCNDWPGPQAWRKRLLEDHYFAADDLNGNASLKGMIAFHFACFSAGTPELDSFSASRAPEDRKALTPRPFVARLPQRLLSHPKGGALAVIGHVDTAWWHSFLWEEAGGQVQAFESTLRELMDGKPVGLAMESFGQRYAELAADLIDAKLKQEEAGGSPEAVRQSYLWTAYHDARSYAIVGDPAVRLPLALPAPAAMQQA